MKAILKQIIFPLLVFFIIITPFTGSNTALVSASSIDSSDFIKKVSKSYTKKFCNAVAFGLSKESAMNFSFEENKQVFKKKKEMSTINTELLAEEIALSVVEKCGYPINLSGEKGVQDFKNYYLTKEK